MTLEDTRAVQSVRIHVADTVPALTRIVGSRAHAGRRVLALLISLATTSTLVALAPRIRSENRLGIVSVLALASVALAAELGGWLVGMLAVAAALGGLMWGYASPNMLFALPEASDAVALVAFTVVGMFVTRAIALARAGEHRYADAQRRLAFLAEASAQLSRTALEYERTLETLAGLAIRHLADACVIYALNDGMLHPVVSAHRTEVESERAESLLHVPPIPVSRDAALSAVARGGDPLLAPRLGEPEVVTLSADTLHANLLRGIRASSAMVVPIRSARGTSFGCALLLLTDDSGRYSQAEVSLVSDLAARAGAALDNVSLYDERMRENRTLASTLMPREIPTVPGFDVAVRFRPAGSPPLIGGDFYDVFAPSQGSWTVLVGDVCGKGVEAASTAALARHTVRAISLSDPAPARTLEELNLTLIRHSSNMFCTVALGLLEEDRIRLAIGGHPLPLLRHPDGRVEPVGEPGMLLGVVEDARASETVVRLEPGATLLIYTDGLLNEHADDPEEALRAIVEKCTGVSAEALLDDLLEIAEGPDDDDVAVVAIRRAAPGGIPAPARA